MNRRPRRTGPERPARAPTVEPPWQPTKRQIRLGIFVTGALLVIGVTIVVFYSLPHRLTAEDRVLIQQYDTVRAALAADDLDSARIAASQLVDRTRDQRKIRQAATSLMDANSLATARAAFAAISSRVIKLASGNAGYYRLGCSATMANCPAPCEPCETMKFGDWIQTSPVVKNPFMGRTHSDCGMLK